jgi:hypothetical protein
MIKIKLFIQYIDEYEEKFYTEREHERKATKPSILNDLLENKDNYLGFNFDSQ